jgi:hypothetical protein
MKQMLGLRISQERHELIYTCQIAVRRRRRISTQPSRPAGLAAVTRSGIFPNGEHTLVESMRTDEAQLEFHRYLELKLEANGVRADDAVG